MSKYVTTHASAEVKADDTVQINVLLEKRAEDAALHPYKFKKRIISSNYH